MNVRIYQINMKRDTNNVAFMNYESLPKFQGSSEIDSSLYDKVFEGEVNCFTLEKLYEIFNLEHPAGYKGRSMSVSDVVEIIDGNTGKSYFHFCDSFGFQQISFKPEKTQVSDRFLSLADQEKISVLLVPVGKSPVVKEIPNTYEAMKELVGGGGLDEYMPFEDDAAIVCNRDGKQEKLPMNRAVYQSPKRTEMSYSELKSLFREAENKRQHLTAHIVFTADTFKKPYSEFERTYEVSSDNKAFQSRMGGYSIYGASLDGVDPCLRMEGLMADEMGGKDGWKIEKCFLIEDSREVADIIHGDFFIARSNIADEKYDSLTQEQMLTYKRLFRYIVRQYRLPTRENKIQKVGGLYGLYLYYCYRLGYLPKHNQKQQNTARLHYLLKDDLMKMDELTKQVTLLGKHQIGTDEQLFSYKRSVEDEIKALTADRTHLRNEIRKVDISDERLSAAKMKISAISERLKELRKEVKLCDGIAKRSGVISDTLSQVKAEEEKSQRKESRNYEQRR